MPTRPLSIWCNLRLGGVARERFDAGTAGHRVTWAANASAGNLPTGRPDATLDERIDVAFGQPEGSQCAALLARPQAALRWVHLSSAGYTAFDTDGIRAALRARDVALTTSSGVFAEPCAQHALALMLSGLRRLPAALADQTGARAWPKTQLRQSSVLLRGQRVLLVGYGAIGRRLTELLRPFAVDVLAVRRTPRGDEPVPTHPLAALDGLLGTADHVLDLLPGNGDTNQLFNAARFAAFKRGATFYNIGRGTTVDQRALQAALAAGQLAAAFLDVTDPEPLPPGDPLWAAPGCFITPHTAGGHRDEPERLVEHFLANLDRHLAGQPLSDRVV